MEIPEPETVGFTVYSKSGCPNCNKVKALLKEKNLLFKVVDCDEFLLEDKPEFLSFMKSQMNKTNSIMDETPIFFPIVFSDNRHVGGYKETVSFLEKLFLSYEDISF